MVDLSAVVVDQDGNPVVNAIVIANEGATESYTGKDGSFSIKAAEKTNVLIEALGYEDYVWDTGSVPQLKKILMTQVPLYTGENSMIELPLGIKESKRNIVGAISVIKGEDLVSYADPLLSNTLQGKGMGLTAIMNEGGMANNPASLYLRGLSRGGSSGVLALVDGIERPIDDINPEEIESIELLKDATAKIIYGPRAANGVLMVKTKRGEKFKKVMKVSVDYGVGMTTKMPEFLDSYDYANLYNEARENDGLEPLYSQQDLDGYKNSTGEYDVRYPNVDFYDYFLKDYTTYTKFSSEFSGGNDNTQYAVILGYNGSTGLQKYGEDPRNDRFNVRGNLDVRVTPSISAFMDLAGSVDYWNRGGVDHSTTFGYMSTHRPNEYPLLISQDYFPVEGDEHAVVGASFDQANNLYGSLVYGGYSDQQYINAQMNFGMNFDLADVTDGLSAKAYVTFDNYFYGTETLAPVAATYAQKWFSTEAGADTVAFVKMKDEDKTTDVEIGSNSNLRNAGYTAQLSYKKAFGDHQVHSNLGYFYHLKEIAGASQNIENTNGFFRTNYSYKNKYVAEIDVACMGSNKFDEGDRYMVYPAVGLGWVMSEESFMSDVKSVNFLKLKASYGILGYDRATSAYLYKTRWNSNGTAQFGETNSGTDQSITNLNALGNPNLGWEESREFNVGVEGLAFNNKLTFEFNYFNELRSDIITKVDANYTSLYGGVYPYTNYGEVANRGFEGEINWRNCVGDLSYQIGGNFIWSKNEVQKKDEILYTEEYRRTVGLSSDAMMGYVSEGIFGKDVELEGHANQTFGSYGVGDIAYKDLNNDGEINDLDKTQVGNNFPRTTLGIDLDLKYKGWGLYVLGTASLGFDTWSDNTYYRNFGNSKYSVLANDRYHPTNNPSGIYPKLTTTTADNNTVASDFWLENTNFFRLKNIELSYTFTKKSMNSFAKSVKVYGRGTNLFSVSNLDDLDPEANNAGVTNYPVLTTLTAGVSVSF